MRDLVRTLRWLWHETFGYHDWRCVTQSFWNGHRKSVLECECGARAEVLGFGGEKWRRDS